MGVERVERRLAAIVAVDVAGYSRLMGRDEEGTLAALRAIRRDLSDPRIKEHQGRIVKTMGDGLLIEFASVVGAVRCSVEVQRAMAERNEGVPADRRIDFRVGIHQGDIIVEDGDIFGDGVNLAARLEGLAEPGGICVSRVVRDEIRDKLDFAFDDMGEQRVKNIARPVRVFRISPDTLTRLAPAVPALGTLSRIAGEGGPSAKRLVGEGLKLPEKPSLAVLPFQNMSGDPEQEYFADGMVEEITTAIARLPWLFVIARNSSFTYKGKAIDALQLDPSYAAAAGLVAWCRGIQRGQGWVRPTGPEDEDGIRLAKLAIEFGTNDPDALWMAAYLLSVVGDQTTALSALDRAIALNPNSAHAWGTKALCQSLRGAAHAAAAVEAGNRAIRLSPLDPLCYIYKFSVALAYLGARQYQDADVWIDDALREQPRFHASFRVKVSLCGLLGKNEEARVWLGRLLALQPGLTIAAWAAHAATFLAPETKALMIEGLRKGGLPE